VGVIPWEYNAGPWAGYLERVEAVTFNAEALSFGGNAEFESL